MKTERSDGSEKANKTRRKKRLRLLVNVEPDAATAAVLYRLDVTFTLKDKHGDSSEGQLKDKKVNVCSLDSLWQDAAAASLWLSDCPSVPETHLEINPLPDDQHLAGESLKKKKKTKKEFIHECVKGPDRLSQPHH